MNIYALLPCNYSQNSAGILTLCKIYESLSKEYGAGIKFLVNSHNIASSSYYQTTFEARLIEYNNENMNEIADQITSETFGLIRPDDLEGIQNPIHWILSNSPSVKFKLNILLAPPFVFSKSMPILDYYCEKDYFILANQAIMPSFEGFQNLDCYIEPEMSVAQCTYMAPAARTQRIAVYIGKGVAFQIEGLESYLLSRNISLTGPNIEYISRTNPSSKSELIRILSSSLFLISFDPFSHIERDATVLGTPVLKPNSHNLRELPGVCRSIDELAELNSRQSYINLRKSSLDDYCKKLSFNMASLDRISLSLRQLWNGEAKGIEQATIHYSQRLLLAFASQYRKYIPLIGEMKLATDVNNLRPEDLAQILGGPLATQAAVAYLAKAKDISSAQAITRIHDRNGRKIYSPIYQYIYDNR